jgi:DNA-binding MarR family transcriptional regulator
MATTSDQRRQAAAGLDQLASLVRAQSWRKDLPPTQAALLRVLEGVPAGQRARQLAERLGISAASLSDSLKALETKGWIERLPDPADGRAAIIRLSAEGKTLALDLLGGDGGMSALLKRLGSEDLGALLRITQLLVSEAQQQGLASGPRTCLGCRFFQPYASGDRGRPHFCGFVQKPFGDPELRVDCADQEAGTKQQQAANARRFRQAASA